MDCPHCGYTLPAPAQTVIIFSNQTCEQCGGEFIIYKNEPMTRSDYLQGKPSFKKLP
jgi:hypothetical protein